MRRRLRTTLVAGGLTLVGWGCEDRNVSAPPAGESPVYHLLNRSVIVGTLHAASSGVDLNVTFLEPSGSFTRRIRIEPAGDGWAGFRIESHAEDVFCYGIGVAWQADDPNRMRFSERASGGALEVDRGFVDGIVTEIYRYEDRVDTLTARGPFDLMDPGAPTWEVAPGAHRDTPWSRRARCAEGVWIRLDRDVEGARLSDLIWRSGLARWLKARIEAPDTEGLLGAPCLLCLCWFGMGESPLCGSCASAETVRAWAAVAAFLRRQ